MPEAPKDSRGPLGGVVPPGPVPDLPIDPLHMETRDTLESLILDQRDGSGPTIVPPAAGTTWRSLRGSPMGDHAGLLSSDVASVARYEALASGQTAGANVERFKDAVARGFFTDLGPEMDRHGQRSPPDEYGHPAVPGPTGQNGRGRGKSPPRPRRAS